MTIGSGADQIDLYYFGRGHTNGDAWVVFPGASRRCTPATSSPARTCRFSTRTTAAAASRSATRWPRPHDGLKNVDTIITGHSTVMTLDDLREYAQFNRDFLAAVQNGRRPGGAEDIAKSWTAREIHGLRCASACPPPDQRANVYKEVQ